MSGDLTAPSAVSQLAPSSGEVAAAIAATDFSACSATVLGYGFMGKHYVKALRALGVGRVKVCSHSAGPLAELQGVPGVSASAGGYQKLAESARSGEIGVVATPTSHLVPAARHLAELGFAKLLIEKPVSLWSAEIQRLAEFLACQRVEAVGAYNRVAYPSFVEARASAQNEGGITSCVYTFTEIIGQDWLERYPAEELARWGVANSLHPIAMAHGLIGMPASWHGYRSGATSWHPAGSVFVGAGISDRHIPFAYQADWGSKGRWSVEVHTGETAYRLCPLERLYAKRSATGDWEEVAVATFDPKVKTGTTEQVAAMLSDRIRGLVPLVSLQQAARLTAFAEAVFGYEKS